MALGWEIVKCKASVPYSCARQPSATHGYGTALLQHRHETAKGVRVWFDCFDWKVISQITTKREEDITSFRSASTYIKEICFKRKCTNHLWRAKVVLYRVELHTKLGSRIGNEKARQRVVCWNVESVICNLLTLLELLHDFDASLRTKAVANFIHTTNLNDVILCWHIFYLLYLFWAVLPKIVPETKKAPLYGQLNFHNDMKKIIFLNFLFDKMHRLKIKWGLFSGKKMYLNKSLLFSFLDKLVLLQLFFLFLIFF